MPAPSIERARTDGRLALDGRPVPGAGAFTLKRPSNRALEVDPLEVDPAVVEAWL